MKEKRTLTLGMSESAGGASAGIPVVVLAETRRRRRGSETRLLKRGPQSSAAARLHVEPSGELDRRRGRGTHQVLKAWQPQ